MPPDRVVVTTEATAVTSTPATMTRNPSRLSSWLTTGPGGGLTMPNMARRAVLMVPIRLIAEYSRATPAMTDPKLRAELSVSCSTVTSP